MLNTILTALQNFLAKPKLIEPDERYRIVAVDDSYENTGKVSIKIQVIGSSKTFNRLVSDLYTKSWLDYFDKEDVAHIAALYTAEHTKNLALIKKFPKRNPIARESVIVISILFTAFLILANLAAFKLVGFHGFTFTAGLIFFPITYIFDDILTEVYGFKVSRRIIWMGLLANTIIVLGTLITTYLPPSPYWHDQVAYATVYQAVLRVFLASIIAYLGGEFTNSIILAKFKIFTSGRQLWIRLVSSTMIGVGVDTILFAHIAFLFSTPYQVIWQLIGLMYTVKVTYEICAIPITYRVINYLKRKDNVDHYDFGVKFNPFSLEID